MRRRGSPPSRGTARFRFRVGAGGGRSWRLASVGPVAVVPLVIGLHGRGAGRLAVEHWDQLFGGVPSGQRSGISLSPAGARSLLGGAVERSAAKIVLPLIPVRRADVRGSSVARADLRRMVAAAGVRRISFATPMRSRWPMGACR